MADMTAYQIWRKLTTPASRGGLSLISLRKGYQGGNKAIQAISDLIPETDGLSGLRTLMSILEETEPVIPDENMSRAYEQYKADAGIYGNTVIQSLGNLATHLDTILEQRIEQGSAFDTAENKILSVVTRFDRTGKTREEKNITIEREIEEGRLTPFTGSSVEWVESNFNTMYRELVNRGRDYIFEVLQALYLDKINPSTLKVSVADALNESDANKASVKHEAVQVPNTLRDFWNSLSVESIEEEEEESDAYEDFGITTINQIKDFFRDGSRRDIRNVVNIAIDLNEDKGKSDFVKRVRDNLPENIANYIMVAYDELNNKNLWKDVYQLFSGSQITRANRGTIIGAKLTTADFTQWAVRNSNLISTNNLNPTDKDYVVTVNYKGDVEEFTNDFSGGRLVTDAMTLAREYLSRKVTDDKDPPEAYQRWKRETRVATTGADISDFSEEVNITEILSIFLSVTEDDMIKPFLDNYDNASVEAPRIVGEMLEFVEETQPKLYEGFINNHSDLLNFEGDVFDLEDLLEGRDIDEYDTDLETDFSIPFAVIANSIVVEILETLKTLKPEDITNKAGGPLTKKFGSGRLNILEYLKAKELIQWA